MRLLVMQTEPEEPNEDGQSAEELIRLQLSTKRSALAAKLKDEATLPAAKGIGDARGEMKAVVCRARQIRRVYLGSAFPLFARVIPFLATAAESCPLFGKFPFCAGITYSGEGIE